MSSQEKIIIDFKKFGGPVYVGQKKGAAVREVSRLDELDKKDIKIYVQIPRDTYSVTSSFIMGLFRASIQSCGSKKIFLDKFIFDCSDLIFEKAEEAIDRALIEGRPLI